jgi:type II secretory pathway component PulM
LVPTGHEEAPATVPLPAGWPMIQGIDAQGASKRLMGDSELLVSVLRSLLAEFGDLAREGDHLRSGEASTSLAARLHKLQGSAGVIGIDGVRAHAAEGEAALKDGDAERADRAMRALGAALRNLQVAAQPYVDAADAKSDDEAAAPVDPDALAALVELLRKQSMAALPMFDELGPSLQTSLGGERFEALDRAMQSLQFRQAVEILQAGVSCASDAGHVSAAHTP